MAVESPPDGKQTEENEKFPLRWMIRPCEVYDDEYSDCTSIKGRFHQYFVHGTTVDCTAWKTDYLNCLRWREEDVKAYRELIDSEKKRRLERLRPHFENNIWKKRTSPPEEWSKPLPAWLEEENRTTYLGIKAEEIRNEGQTKPGDRSMCVIS